LTAEFFNREKRYFSKGALTWKKRKY
jgi:hypothetical protein